jgi:hypothetical protein
MLPVLSEAIDQWIKEQPKPKPTRPEAVRRLIAIGLGKAPK